mmetsp:Transcript_23883/g.50462  ORF Transcript_23883/g.50462 Transcript_23883/m.50462 type:complete len:256 (+) Transcript_23883:1293-2060(+)
MFLFPLFLFFFLSLLFLFSFSFFIGSLKGRHLLTEAIPQISLFFLLVIGTHGIHIGGFGRIRGRDIDCLRRCIGASGTSTGNIRKDPDRGLFGSGFHSRCLHGFLTLFRLQKLFLLQKLLFALFLPGLLALSLETLAPPLGPFLLCTLVLDLNATALTFGSLSGRNLSFHPQLLFLRGGERGFLFLGIISGNCTSSAHHLFSLVFLEFLCFGLLYLFGALFDGRRLLVLLLFFRLSFFHLQFCSFFEGCHSFVFG